MIRRSPVIALSAPFERLPHLRGRIVLALAEDVEVLAVWRPTRTRRGNEAGLLRNVDRLGLPAGEVDDPDAGDTLVFRVVRLAQLVGDTLAVRRDLRIADAVHHDQIVHVERVRLGDGSNGHEGENGERKSHRVIPFGRFVAGR